MSPQRSAASWFGFAASLLAILLVSCSSNADDKYVGMRIYGDTFFESADKYETAFPVICDWIVETRMSYSDEQIERIGLRTLAINDSYEAAGVGFSSAAIGPEPDAMRDFIAIHSDEAVIHECAWLLIEWRRPGTRIGADLDDIATLPVHEFVGTP